MKYYTGKEEHANAWKGDNIGYVAIHLWLRTNFGKAIRCENVNCRKTSKKYHWALKKCYRYQRRRENFIQLCFGCHSIYDGKIDAMSKAKLKPVRATNETSSIRFSSIKEAIKYTGLSAPSISNALRGRPLSAGNFKWSYE